MLPKTIESIIELPQTRAINILIIEDNDGDVLLLTEVLKSSRLNVGNLFYAKTLSGAFDILNKNKVTLVLLDLSLPDSNGLDSFEDLQKFNQEIPVIILTGLEDTNLALIAINHGAQDYLVKSDLDEKLLNKSILYSIERKRISESLRLSNERYNLVSKATNDIVWDWDLSKDRIYRNEEGLSKVFGNLLGDIPLSIEAWRNWIHPEDVSRVNETITNFINDKTINNFEIEYRASKGDGIYFHISDRAYAIRDAHGKAVRLIGAMQNITGKKLAEQELKRLSLIVKETKNPIIISDKEGRITWVNEAFFRVTGYSFDEVVGKIPGELLQGPETNPVIKRYMHEKIKLLKAFECDVINYSKTGRKYWVRIQCQPQFNENGELTNFFALQTDITNEKEAEQNLMNSERKFRALIENSKDGMTVVQEDGVVLDISVSGQKMLGYTRDEYIGKVRSDLIHPDDLSLVNNSFQDVIKDPANVQSIVYRFRKANGTYTWIESTFHNLLNEPSIHAILLHYREINERKEAADLLKSSEAKYRNLFNNNPSSIFIWNPENLSILEVNDAAIEEYGYSRKEFLKLKVTDLNVKGSGEEIKDMAVNLLTNKNFRSHVIWQHATKAGAACFMDITFQAIDYFGQKASLAIVKNISEQVSLEKKLSLERMERQQEITAAVITAQEQEREELGKELHDNINQILATTRLYIEYAQTNVAMHDELLNSAKEFIMTAVNEIRNLSKRLSPPSLGEIGLEVALEELFDNIRTINKYAFFTEWKDIDERLISDKLKLTIFRIVQEQLNNIIKHAHAKSVWVKIKMKNHRLLISVKDDGNGFDMVEKSTGVGLKNISSRADLYNGTMQMHSEPGKGCELKVLFPI